MMMYYNIKLVGLAVVLLTILGNVPNSLASGSPNVLLIMVDDLRGGYKADGIKTPNIDRIASNGMTFNRSYATVAVCGASRASMFSGLNPTRSRFTSYNTRVDNDAPGIATIGDTLKASGYITISNGKTYHNQDDDNDGWTQNPIYKPDSHQSWRSGQRSGEPSWLHWQTLSPVDSSSGRGPAYEKGIGVADDFYSDGVAANKAIQDISNLTQETQPFFMALGFDRPHLPFNAPEQYWDMYSQTEIDDAHARYEALRFRPDGAPSAAFTSWGEIQSYAAIDSKSDITTDENLRRTLVHGYFAAASYTDAQIGKVLDALEDPNGDGDTSDSIRDDTIIMLVGDHGWMFGENDIWTKHTNFEKAHRTPILISTPEMTGPMESDALVSLLDVYPTLMALTDTTAPGHLVGMDMTPLLDDPDALWRQGVISRYGSGDSIRTDQYRYTEWTDSSGNITARMLYDHLLDPNETVNIIGDHPELATQLSQLLRQGWMQIDSNPIADLDGDGVMGQGDIDIFVTNWMRAFEPSDIGEISMQFGDLDQNGVIDQFDWGQMFRAFQQAGVPLDGLTVVPEPACVILLGIGLILQRRRRQSI